MIVITGGGSGIGKSLAIELAKRGQTVLIIGRREQPLRETAASFPNIAYFCADVSTKEGLDSIRHYLQAIPQINALVNNAGILKPLACLKEIDYHEWNQAVHTNLNPALFLPQMLFNQLTHGRVLNIGSGAAYYVIKGWAAYCVTKLALSMLTKCWQLESETIAFASVMPGIIDTNMQTLAQSELNPDQEGMTFYQRLKEHQRLISTDTVAQFLAWLLLDVDQDLFKSKEWDIYDTKHHQYWLKLPHKVLHWDF